MEIIVKTPRGLEKVAAARIMELDPSASVSVKPSGFVGLVIVESCGDRDALLKAINNEVLECERAIPVERETSADPGAIARVAAELVRGRISEHESFAVRTTRRGSHAFTSIDVNVSVGEAVKRATDAVVNLDYPDKLVVVEVVGDRAAVAVLPGGEEWRKMKPTKKPATEFFSRISVVQMPYLGEPRVCREFGVRIGRGLQSLEVGELVVAPHQPVDAAELHAFLAGLFEGIDARLTIQRKTYHRPVSRLRVLIQDLYQLVRDRRNEPIVVFEPEGETLAKTELRLKAIFGRGGRVNFLVGAREGIPKGVMRNADLVVDLAPSVTISTDFAAVSAVMAVYTALQEEV